MIRCQNASSRRVETFAVKIRAAADRNGIRSDAGWRTTGRKVEAGRTDHRTKNRRKCPHGLIGGGDSQAQLTWLAPEDCPACLGPR
jgi:hypothetical protein